MKAIILILIAAPAGANPELCAEGRVMVSAPPALTDRICSVSSAALDRMAACGLIITRPVRIDVVSEIGAHCAGLYHCGEDRILLLSPERLPDLMTELPLFEALDIDTYFDSLLVHELVHAAYDEVACPFESGCVATSEYLAYSLQLEWLGPEGRDQINLPLADETPIDPAALNAIVAAWSPHLFAVKAWAHLQQQHDQCAHIRKIAEGRLYYDSDTP